MATIMDQHLAEMADIDIDIDEQLARKLQRSEDMKAPAQAIMESPGSAPAAPSEPPKKKKESNKRVMDEVMILKDAWWCAYCCCAGCGCGHPAFSRLLMKCCCYRCSFENGGHGFEKDHLGCCQNICNCCCVNLYCQHPCRAGAPRCVCCNERMNCFGSYPWTDQQQGQQPMYEFLLYEQWACMYCCCCGLSWTPEPLACCRMTQICCRDCRCVLTEAAPDCGPNGLCTCLSACSTCYTICSFPPQKEGNPGVACCGLRCRKKERTIGVLGPGGKRPTAPEPVRRDSISSVNSMDSTNSV